MRKHKRNLSSFTVVIPAYNEEVASRYRKRRSGEAKNASVKVVIDTFAQALALWWKVNFKENRK